MQYKKRKYTLVHKKSWLETKTIKTDEYKICLEYLVLNPHGQTCQSYIDRMHTDLTRVERKKNNEKMSSTPFFFLGRHGLTKQTK